MNAPKPPDPVKTAQAQADMNTQTATTQFQLGATNQQTPYGSLTYNQIGTWDDGTPRFEATTAFSPEQQQLYDQLVSSQSQFGNIAGNLLGNVSQSLSTPWDANAGAATHITDMQRTFMDPEWESREQGLTAQLAARGLTPGGEAWDERMGDLFDARGDAYNQMYLDSYRTAMDASLRERTQPLTELTSMLSLTQPQIGSFQTTPQPGVAPVDYSGLVQSNYAAENANHQAMMAGLFSIPTAIAGGWARGGMPMPSDRRLKTDVERIGADPRGFGVYAYRYLWDAPGTQRVGVMADEVAPIAPEAVLMHPAGWLMVDYGAL
jgi:hypothetical protein